MKDSTATKWARAAAGLVGLLAVTVVLALAPASSPTVTVTKTTTAPDGKVTVEKTVKPADDSALDRTLSRGGDLLVRLGLAAAAAFVAGAVVQRTLLGKFAFKAGGVELPDIEAAVTTSADALEELRASIDEQRDLVQQAAVRARLALELAASLTRAEDNKG
jgi:hypothetical protein